MFSVNYVQSYRSDLIKKNLGCGNSIAYGNYIYPKGIIDALYMISNLHVYSINFDCQRKETFAKIFGYSQDYENLI